jgi:hypothetical protein
MRHRRPNKIGRGPSRRGTYKTSVLADPVSSRNAITDSRASSVDALRVHLKRKQIAIPSLVSDESIKLPIYAPDLVHSTLAA